MTWKAMDKAPRDGTVVLIGYAPHPRMVDSRRVYEGRWNELEQEFTSVNGFVVLKDCTAWMPMPNPPNE